MLYLTLKKSNYRDDLLRILYEAPGQWKESHLRDLTYQYNYIDLSCILSISSLKISSCSRSFAMTNICALLGNI